MRITNGVCPRITNSVCPGKGDKGYTRIKADGKAYSKSDPATHFYGSAEMCRVAIDRILSRQRLLTYLIEIPFLKWPVKRILQKTNYLPISQPEVVEVLEFLQQALFNINAYCYSACYAPAGENRHEFPETFQDYILEQTELWWANYAESKEFQYFQANATQSLDEVRTCIRKMEVWYTEWRESPEVMAITSENLSVALSVERHGALLNRLSSYFWCAILREQKIQSLKPTFWGYNFKEWTTKAHAEH